MTEGFNPKQFASVKKLQIGVGVDIHPTAEFTNLDELIIGDHTYIGPGVRIMLGSFKVGDYSKIHNNVYIYSKNYVHLGHGNWIGQSTHLDGTGGITIGNFFGIGINSAMHSHIRHGDVNEGSIFNKNSKLIIEDDVWFVGTCFVSPIHAKRKSMALLGSVIVKDIEENTVVAGNPARDITDRIGIPWKEKSIDEKAYTLNEALDEYCSTFNVDRERFVVCDNFPQNLETDRTYYNVAIRQYTKTNTVEEVKLNKWLFGFRAKFTPMGKD